MPKIPAPNDHTKPKSQPPVGSLLRGGSPSRFLYFDLVRFCGACQPSLSLSWAAATHSRSPAKNTPTTTTIPSAKSRTFIPGHPLKTSLKALGPFCGILRDFTRQIKAAGFCRDSRYPVVLSGFHSSRHPSFKKMRQCPNLAVTQTLEAFGRTLELGLFLAGRRARGARTGRRSV